MKAFLEEYGLVIVVIIVVAVLIALAVYFSTRGRAQITNTYDTFSNGAMTIVNKSMEDASKAAQDAAQQTGGGN